MTKIEEMSHPYICYNMTGGIGQGIFLTKFPPNDKEIYSLGSGQGENPWPHRRVVRRKYH